MSNFIADANLRTLLQVDCLLAIGLVAMTGYTSLQRIARKVYATAEDYALNRMALPTPASDSSQLDDPIARARRIHQNHLENVLPFLVLSALYALTRPEHMLFASLLWGYLALRLAYTFCYARGLQPHRTILFSLGLVIQLTVATLTLLATFSA